MVDYQGMVSEFMAKHNQYRRLVPGGRVPNDVAMLRMRLIGEEAAELLVAMHERDLVTIADALCDLLYVIYGTGTAYGLTVFPENYRFEHGPMTTPGMLSVAHCMHWYTRISNRTDLLIGTLANTEESLDFYRDLLKKLNTLTEEVFNCAYAFSLPIEELFCEVQRSNMTKGLLGSNQKGGKVGKSSSFEPPQLAKILRSVVIA